MVRGVKLLPKDDQDVVELLEAQMVEDGVKFLYETVPHQFSKDELTGEIMCVYKAIGNRFPNNSEQFDVVLFACGRTPNIEGMGLDEAGIESDRKGVLVNDLLLTTNQNVFAVGDCIDGPKFTHASGEHARTVIRNALFFGSAKRSQLIIPYCTYTDPEIA